jgi:Na+/proline symporter
MATVISFAGVFYVETYFSTDIITEITSTESAIVGKTFLWWTIFATLLLVVTFYSVLGGLRAVIVTDTWQLSTTYICLSIVFSFLISKSFIASPSTAIVLLAAICAIYLAIFIVGWNTNEGIVKPGSLVAGFFIMLIPSISQAVNAMSTFQIQSIRIEGISKQIGEPWGFVTMIGFAIINLAWQFCDHSNFQRISALSLTEEDKEASKDLKAILHNISIVSPLTWGLGIILGMLVKSSNIIPAVPVEKGTQVFGIFIEAMKEQSLTGDIVSLLVLASLIASLIAIMMSTCDSAILAGLHVLQRDFLASAPRISRKYLVTSGLIIILLASVIAVIHRFTATSSILTVMNGAYSSVLVLFPIAFNALRRKKISRSQSVVSISLGLTAYPFRGRESSPRTSALLNP